jgi:CDP-glycerol glycerophosphotransferase (TagB/SpsB family)
MFGGSRDYRRFCKLPSATRSIVFYAESRNDWHHFSPVIEGLTGHYGRTVSYLTSDPNDLAFAAAGERLRVFHVGEGLVRTWAFYNLRADLLVLTMMDLHNLQLKRSLHPVHYVYLFHAPGSTHMVDHAGSYDHYDTILCVGPHHVKEIRARERQAGLPAKHLVEHGYHRIEQLVDEARRYRRRRHDDVPTILVAPTWGATSVLHLCGESLLGTLLEAGYRVILRPHYVTVKRSASLIADLKRRFGAHPGFEYVDLMGETDSLLEADLLVCDWSSMAIEYALALEKPVLFIDVPMRVRNPEWPALGIEPMEIAIRERVGRVLAPSRVAEAPALIRALLAEPEQFRANIAAVRQDYLFNFGHSAEAAAAEIVRLADERATSRLQARG